MSAKGGARGGAAGGGTADPHAVASGPGYHWLSATELGARLRAGDCSSAAVTDAMLARIGRLEVALGAYVHVFDDEARAAAAAADRELRNGHRRGPLHGVPVAVKDLCAVRGVPTAAGTTILRDRIAEEDACIVGRLRRAGAVLLGTLTMTEGAYAMHHPDVAPPRNPWDAARWCGVSSSGSGVAAAAGLAFATIGTDTGGSIRLPSAANGIVGIKPTWGRVPLHGVFPLAPSLDHVGPMTRTVADAASLLGVIAGPDPRDPTSSLAPVADYTATIGDGIRGVRIGIDESYARDGADASVVDPVMATTAMLRDAGAEIRHVVVPPWEETIDAWTWICTTEALLSHQGLFPERADEYGPFLRLFLETAQGLRAIDLARAQVIRRTFAGRLAALFAEVDLLLCPTLGVAVPPQIPDWTNPTTAGGLMRFTIPFDMSGSPTISVPCGFAPDGMPVSMQLVGRHFDEALLCRAGQVVEVAAGVVGRHPEVG